jgi:3-phenylpropionate/trans-cinnamate dioxygenase ferredoxin reductase subunit
MSSLVIVGGGASGLAAARTFREAGGQGEVTILTPEPDNPYARPALSKGFLRGEADAGDIGLADDAFYSESGIEVRRQTTVEALDTEKRELTLEGGETVAYDACILATGSEPIRIPVPGGDDPAVHTLRSLEDARNLRERVEGAHTAAVIGTGFIGCEAAASLAMRGLRVTQVSDEHIPHLKRLGEDAGSRISSWLTELGVSLQLGAGVESLDGGAVRVPGQPPVEADVVLMAVGVRPRGGLAESAGLAMERNHVVVDEQMRTSADGVYATGDIALARHALAGRGLSVEHWVDAQAHGKVAGAAIAGQDAAWDSVPAFFSTIGERTLKYKAWGDGFDDIRFVEHAGGAFTVYYGKAGRIVGVLSHEHDEDYEAAGDMIADGRPMPGA